MDLDKLFKTQKKLDDRIVIEKGLQGVDLLDKKILALQVELGELANEWQLFKFWKDSPEPKNKVFRWENGLGEKVESEYNPRTLSEAFDAEVIEVNPLLEEYVDCLHFILSIGNEDKSYSDFDMIVIMKSENVVKQFRKLFKCISKFDNDRNWMSYKDLLSTFMGLGEMLGFTWGQIEQAYYDKNKINHERQDEGY